MPQKRPTSFYRRVREILESARAGVARTVNTTQVMTNWLIGREIVEEEQRGKKRADYGARLIADLSARLQADFGRGYSVKNLELFRSFYRVYPNLGEFEIPGGLALRLLPAGDKQEIPYTVCTESELSPPMAIRHAVRSESWRPGFLHPNLSWSLNRWTWSWQAGAGPRPGARSTTSSLRVEKHRTSFSSRFPPVCRATADIHMAWAS
jgi:hypothetical protein